ncbi:MAG TPA: CapA family protein [Candidatus Aquicultor sp.]|jgi:poly-gamma-glutamate synthesis protein (capsule biosynthesis protein)
MVVFVAVIAGGMLITIVCSALALYAHPEKQHNKRVVSVSVRLPVQHTAEVPPAQHTVVKPLANTTAPSLPLTLCAVGDISFMRKDVRYNKAHAFPHSAVTRLLQNADLTFGNLESALSTRGTPIPGKKYTFCGGPQHARLLKAVGFDVLSTANNHSKDYGAVALLDTLKMLKDNQLISAGSGQSIADAYRPVFLTLKGTRVAFLAFSNVMPPGFGVTASSCGVASIRDSRRVAAAFHEARRSADVVVISIHWGKELSTTPSRDQINAAHKLIDQGADIILGHHPHVVQGIEIYKGKMVAYSLGNFIFSPGNSLGRQSMLLIMQLSDGKLRSASVYPIYIEGVRPARIGGSRGCSLLRGIALRSQSFKTPCAINTVSAELTISNK